MKPVTWSLRVLYLTRGPGHRSPQVPGFWYKIQRNQSHHICSRHRVSTYSFPFFTSSTQCLIQGHLQRVRQSTVGVRKLACGHVNDGNSSVRLLTEIWWYCVPPLIVYIELIDSISYQLTCLWTPQVRGRSWWWILASICIFTLQENT